MKQSIILDTSAGISGDMAAAALIDLSAGREAVLSALAPFESDGIHAQIRTITRQGTDCVNLSVSSASHMHRHEHHSLSQVKETICRADLTAGARRCALRVYDLLARAEAKAHDTSVEAVMFHEVGSLRAIMNVLAFAVSYEILGGKDVIVPSFTEGVGTVRCEHGELAIPGPAVTNLLRGYSGELRIRQDIHAELITPTGAACALAVCSGHAPAKNRRLIRTGYGAGLRDTGLSGILRAELTESEI